MELKDIGVYIGTGNEIIRVATTSVSVLKELFKQIGMSEQEQDAALLRTRVMLEAAIEKERKILEG